MRRIEAFPAMPEKPGKLKGLIADLALVFMGSAAVALLIFGAYYR